MKYLFLKKFKKISILFFLMLFFIGLAQDKPNDIKILQDKIKVFEDSGDILKKEYRTSVNDLAFLYRKEGKLLDTETLLLKVIKIAKENVGEKDMEYAESLYNLAMFYNENHDFIKDEPLFYKALEIIKENRGEKNIEYINSMNNLANIFANENKFLKAESLLLKAKELQNEISGEKDKNYAEILLSLVKLYIKQGDFNKSKILISNLLNICKDVYGEKTIEYISILFTNADLYKNHGDYAEAEDFFLKTLEILKEISGEKTKEYTSALNHLGLTYTEQGRYLEAESLFRKSIEINKVLEGEKGAEYAASLNNLGLVYEKQGKFVDAEPLYINAIKIIKETLGMKSSYYATFINNLGFLYKDFGKFSQAESIFLEALEIRKENLGEKNIDYITSLNNLALIYSDQGKTSESIPLYLRSIELSKEVLGEKHPYYATIIDNLGLDYVVIKKYSDAEPLFLKSLQIRKEVLGEKNNDYAIALNNLGLMFNNQGNYKAAEPLFIEAMKIIKENLGKNHPDFMVLLSNLAIFYKNQDEYENTVLYFNEFIKSNQIRITGDIYCLSDKELVDYINFKNINFAQILSILNDIQEFNPGINNNCYENGLLTKNLSLRNQDRIKKSIQNSKNKVLQIKYQQFIDNKKKIKKIQDLPIVKQPSILKSLVDETEQIEKELSKESTTFAEYKKVMTTSLENIRNKLKNDEVAIDIIAFRYWNKKWTDSIVYAAFTVKKDYNVPKFITLFEHNQIDFLLSRNKTQQDSTRINKQYIDKSITNLFLKPLQEELQGITTLYISLSGLAHKIDFAALPITDNQSLGEKYKVHILNSSTELVDYKAATLDKKNNIEFLLYGGIDYNKSTTKVNLEEEKEVDDDSDDLVALRTRSGISGFDYLNGTNNEISQIQLKSNQNGFTASIFKEYEATKGSIVQLDGRTTPYVLHLATHGFFFADPIQELSDDFISVGGKAKIYKSSNDPMMRSGLIFAGANNYWNNTNDDNTIDDGILTASEISNLDLSACQLVVLSACETGLGEVKGSEGVFGLQRAFKMAGVKNIIMSLWKVPDTQTAELFDIFYSECFAGKTIHEAFQSAQTKMKAKYSPYYWAGFVLLE
jgi:CHAT domain-containing protein/tetratricopeptide (TPR) repeat protein